MADEMNEPQPGEMAAAEAAPIVAVAAAEEAAPVVEPAAVAVMPTPAAALPVPGVGGGGEDEEEEDDDEKPVVAEKKAGRRKINIEFIEDKSRRHITFSKRKAGIMKKAYELSALTGTQVLLLVASETGHVYTYATEKLQPLIQKPEGKNLIQTCLSAPDQQAAMQSAQQQQIADGASQYAAMAAAAAAAQAAERPAKARKLGANAAVAGIPGYGAAQQQMAGLAQYQRAAGLPFGSMGMPAGFGQQAGGQGLPFGLDPRGLAGLSGMPGMPNAAQLQGLSPALLQGLMSGQLPSPAMMGMDGAFGGGVKLDALQRTIQDAANAANGH